MYFSHEILHPSFLKMYFSYEILHPSFCECISSFVKNFCEIIFFVNFFIKLIYYDHDPIFFSVKCIFAFEFLHKNMKVCFRVRQKSYEFLHPRFLHVWKKNIKLIYYNQDPSFFIQKYKSMFSCLQKFVRNITPDFLKMYFFG